MASLNYHYFMVVKRRGIFSKVFAFARSLKVTIVLMAYLVIAGAVSTLVPQGMGPEVYWAQYPPGLANFLMGSGLTHFFRSPGFFVPAGLFFVNLLACTVFRFNRELRKKSRRNFGPDILHGGLLLFMAAAVFSYAGRDQGSVTLSPGESAILPGGNTLILDDFEFIQYDDGRPRAWISYVTVLRNGEVFVSGYPIQVNHPLKLDRFSLYQVSYGNFRGRQYSVLRVAEDPGYTFVLISLIIIGAGGFITLIPKLRKAPHG